MLCVTGFLLHVQLFFFKRFLRLCYLTVTFPATELHLNQHLMDGLRKHMMSACGVFVGQIQLMDQVCFSMQWFFLKKAVLQSETIYKWHVLLTK